MPHGRGDQSRLLEAALRGRPADPRPEDHLNRHPFTILGVTQPGFSGDTAEVATEVWIPLSMQPQVNPGRDYLDRWDTSWLLLMGRLKPGTTLAQARAGMVPARRASRPSTSRWWHSISAGRTRSANAW